MQRGFTPIIILMGIVILAGLVGGGYYFIQQQKIKNINSFEECAKVYPVMMSYPGQCRTPDGRNFTQVISAEEKKKLQPPGGQVCIQVITPARNSKTGECKDFPNPCVVPEGWEKVDKCSASSVDTTNWKTYTSAKYKYSIAHPPSLYVKEFETSTAFTFVPFPAEGPGLLELIEVSIGGSYLNTDFDALFKAGPGDDVPEAHHAVDVKVTKLKNIKIGQYDAVEYLRDGIKTQKNGPGRGPIGYEHKILIKKSAQEFIELINSSMDPEKTKEHDKIFNQMVATFKFLDANPSPSGTSKNQCGDGVCQEVTCQAIGCPKPETKESCPADCK